MAKEETPATTTEPEKVGSKKGKRATFAKPIPQPTAGTKGKVKKQYPATEAQPPRGRRKLKDALSPREIQAEVDELLGELRATQDPEEKKRIRRALRHRGHFGGLGEKTGRKKKVDEKEEPGDND